MLKHAESGYVAVVKREQTHWAGFIPAAFALVVLILVTSAVRLDLAFLFAVPPIIWFVGVPVWDRLCGGPSAQKMPETQGPPVDSKLHAELGATTAGLAILGILIVAATSVLSLASVLALSITGGILLSLAATPALKKREGKYRVVGGYAGLRSWVFQGMLLLPILTNSARCRHYNAVSSQNDEGRARMGETYFAFLRRFIVGSFARSVAPMVDEMPQTAKKVAQTDDLTKLLCFSLLFILFAYFAGGSQMVVLAIVQAFVALWQILALEYTEHYGIQHNQPTSSPGEEHAEHFVWRGTGKLNTALLSGRTSHTFTITGSINDARAETGVLPYGFNALSILVLWPAKWFSLVDNRLAESVNFDLHDVNLDGNAYVALMEKYHHQGGKLSKAS